jgi:hypothetical protein
LYVELCFAPPAPCELPLKIDLFAAIITTAV